MRDDEKPENQHYVTKMLLKNFCTGNTEQIYVYDQWTRRSFPTNIKNISCERDFNVATEGDDRLNGEPVLTSFEDAAKDVIEKLLQHRQLSPLTPKDGAVLSTFVAAQYMRTKHTRAGFLQLNAAMAAHIRKMGVDPAAVENFKELDENSVKALSLAMLQAIPELSMHVRNKQWLVLAAAPATDFIFLTIR